MNIIVLWGDSYVRIPGTVHFRSPLLQDLLTVLMDNCSMDKTVELATFHSVTLLLRYLVLMDVLLRYGLHSH